jgi:signal transduction histidine kinase
VNPSAKIEMEDSPLPEARRAESESRRLPVVVGCTVLILAGWTASIVVVRQLRFDVVSPRFRLPLETVGFLVSYLVAALAYFRFALTGFRGWLLLSTAFVVLAANHLVFGVVLQPAAPGIDAGLRFYEWTAARLLTGTLLVAATFAAEPRDPEVPSGSVWRPAVRMAVASLGALALVDLGLTALRFHLPRPPSAKTVAGAYALHGLTATDVVLGLVGAGLFLWAAWRLRSMRAFGSMGPWLIVSLIVAAFSHLHFMFVPTIFTDRLSTGDLLRLGLSIVLLLGFLWELRRSEKAELAQARLLMVAYAAERSRVAELESLERTKAELFGLLTHELMHPVAAIRGFAWTLQSQWDSLDDEQRFSIVEQIERGTVQLRDMAEESVTVLRLDTEPFELVRRAEPAMEIERDAAAMMDELHGRLKVRVDEGAERVAVLGDRARILQVLRNLLSNAEMYSEPDTPIELRVASTDSEVVFSVSDHGPGIAENDVDRLFQRFSRIRPAGKEHLPGSGLGLYICKRIVELHGGRIWVENRPGEGTTFSFTIPMAAHG